VSIDVPKRLSDEQRALLEQFSRTLSETPQPKPGRKTIFNKVKDAFTE